MIRSVTLDFQGRELVISVCRANGVLRAQVIVSGRIIKDFPLAETSPDEAIYALIGEIDREETARLTLRENFQCRETRYTIEVWPAGRCMKTRVLSDEGESETVSWDNPDFLANPRELFAIVQSEIRFGRMETLSPKPRRDL